MGVQPRPFAVAESEADKSPSVRKATSPATRKRRYVDVVLVGDAAEDDADEECELTQRVSFKRAKSGEPSLRVHVHEMESAPRDSESFEPITPTASSTGGTSPRDKTSPSGKTPARPNMSASQTITLDMLRPHFEKPLAQVAQVFGICVTLLKKICRKNGLARWPHRQIIGLRKSIASMEQAIGHFEGARRESYAQQLDKQRNKLAALLEDPTKCNLLAVDDEYLPSQPTTTTPPMAVRSSTVPSHMPAQPTTYYSAYAHAAPAPVYQRAPVAYVDYYHTPAHQQAAYAPHHHYYPGSYAPAPQYHRIQHQHQQHYHSPTQHALSAMLPPLRTDARQALPSLSALVGRRW